jgi:hypothetical protein
MCSFGVTGRRRPRRAFRLSAVSCGLFLAAGASMAASADRAPSAGPASPRFEVIVTPLDAVGLVIGSPSGFRLPAGGVRAVDCERFATHTDASFESGGQYTVQTGFAEREIAAASYTLPAGDFPLRVVGSEMIFVASGTTVPTVTHWSLLVWEGNPQQGSLVGEFVSDDVFLPHLRIPAGTHAVNVKVIVDPDDPEQLIINNTSGSNTFSVGYRIDRHNDQQGDPCVTPPDRTRNAFPTTDVSGLLRPADNWLYHINGTFCFCPGAGTWTRFRDLGPCRPSGDWVIRATWHPEECVPGFGACCLPDETCEGMFEQDCDGVGGVFIGEGLDCADVVCPEFTQACCFEGGACLDLTRQDCIDFEGFPQGVGTNCDGIECFPRGACCLADGSCQDDLPVEECEARNGEFQGNNTLCRDVSCPLPLGACCRLSGACLDLTEEDCNRVPDTTWQGFGTMCLGDHNSNGRDDACEAGTCTRDPQWVCDGDVDGNGAVNPVDVGLVQAAFCSVGECPEQDLCQYDLDCNDTVNPVDVGIVQSRFGMCDPPRDECP